MKTLDCRGLACPGPVIQVKKTLEETRPGESFSIDLDTEASRDNVLRFVKGKGAVAREEETGDSVIRLVITAPFSPESGNQGQWETVKKPPAVFISSDILGTGDDKLGAILMEGFINTLLEQEDVPDRILLMNGAVRLAVGSSPLLGAMKKLTDRGCDIMVCGTCLDFFGIMDQLAVGTVSNMYDIQKELLVASSVVRI
ncbi:MAG: sulfurtransferase-like selenium metabolism protein YedF [Pseudomonadota bacterium]|jgi:selenium metabolism protein YedF